MNKLNCTKCKNDFEPSPWPATGHISPNNRNVFCSKECRTKFHASREFISAEKAKGYNLKHKFGISLDDFNKMLSDQDNKCAICNEEETWFIERWNKMASLAIDHDHESGKIRALLCRRCNQILGRFNDDPELFDKAAAYLRRHE